MKSPELLDIYSDYLLSSFAHVTAVGLSMLLDSEYSHDKISRFLSQEKLKSRDFWKKVKPLIRKIEIDNGIISIDDTIEEKPHTTENEIVCWHWDHSKKCNIKGIQILNFLYNSNSSISEDVTIPVAYEIISKTQKYYDEKTKKLKRRSVISKNELVRDNLRVIKEMNKVKFRYVVWDSWFSSKENLSYVHTNLKKNFVASLKSNRTLALSYEEKRQGKSSKVSELELAPNRVYKVWLKGLDFEVSLIKQVFTNKDGSIGEVFLITDATDLSCFQIQSIYQKRWSVEVFHKSLKQNASLEKSPTKNEVTQSNHIFASMIAYCKLEILKFKEGLNHFQLKAKLYIHAVKAAFKELHRLKILCNENKIITDEQMQISLS